MIDVFISYARDDKHRARELAQTLKDLGFKVSWDWDFFGCEDIRDAIRTAIGNATKVVVLWSLDSIESPLVLDEATEAKRLDKLVSVSIDGAAPPPEFAEPSTISLVEPETGLEHLVAALEGRTPRPRTAHKHMRRLRHVLTGSALALGLSMAALTFWRELPTRLPDLYALQLHAPKQQTVALPEVDLKSPQEPGVPQAEVDQPKVPALPQPAPHAQAEQKSAAPANPAAPTQAAKGLLNRPPTAGVCVVNDPAGAPMNVLAQPQGAVVSTLANGRSVLIADVKNDEQGQPWVLVASTEGGDKLGWGSGKNVTCP
jgi:hypothetical protein